MGTEWGRGRRRKKATQVEVWRQKRCSMLSVDKKAPAAFRMYWAPEALGPHLLRAEAPNLRQHGVRSNELTRVPCVL